MRFWPARRRAGAAEMPPTDDLLVTEDLLRRNVEDLLHVRERQIQGSVIVFRGDLLVTPARAVDVMASRFRSVGYTPFIREADGQVAVHAVPLGDTIERPRVWVNVVLFLLTCLSTLAAGALFAYDPARGYDLASGVPFAFTLLAILGTHEFGHYFTARHYKASVSLPYFIPAPPPFIFGTLGAIIRMRSPATNRNSLFDIAAAGPLAGLAIAVPAIVIGLGWSAVGRIPAEGAIMFGDSLLMRLLVYARFGPLPAGTDVFVHPVAMAGWVGLLVTALNLFPLGQLDGGRIAYALFGRRHGLVGKVTFVALLALGAITQSLNWFVWAALLFFMIGFHHSPPLDDVTPLSPGRRVTGVACLILLVLLIPPIPVQVN